MPSVKVDPPDISGIDHASERFKRVVAVVVVFATLLVSCIGLLQHRASGEASRQRRISQLSAVDTLGLTVDANGDFLAAYVPYADHTALQGRRHFARNARQPEVVERLNHLRSSLVKLSPLLGDERYTELADDRFPNRYFYDELQGADRARLIQAGADEIDRAQEGKASTYNAALTVLAVALLLLGLSLTIGRSRLVLFVPGLLMGLFCGAWAVTIAQRDMPILEEAAIDEVVVGDKLVSQGKYEDAIAAFTRALEIRGDYAEALSARANARFLAGGPTDMQRRTVVNIIDPASRDLAIEDSLAAIRHGAGDDPEVVGRLGALLFHANRMDDSARRSRAAIALNPQRHIYWMNLGAAQLGSGRDGDAARSYDRALELVAAEPNAISRQALYASGRSVLDELIGLRPSRTDAARRMQARITGTEMNVRLNGHFGDALPGAEVDVTLRPEGAGVRASFDVRNLPRDTPIGLIWYHRRDGSQPWDQPPQMNEFGYLDKEMGSYSWVRSLAGCPVDGQYRLDFYLGARLAATATTSVPELSLGPLVLETNVILAASACRPQNWEVYRDDEAFWGFTAPDQLSYFRISVFPLDPATTTDMRAAEDQAVNFILQPLTAPLGATYQMDSFSIGGVETRRGTAELKLEAPVVLQVAAVAGPDNLMRIIMWVSVKRAQPQVDELVASLRFTDLPSA